MNNWYGYQVETWFYELTTIYNGVWLMWICHLSEVLR